LAKDSFGTEFKIFYTTETKITLPGPSNATRSVADIQVANPQDEILKKDQSLTIDWEAQGTKRVARAVTISK
jgi:hypothetical protein